MNNTNVVALNTSVDHIKTKLEDFAFANGPGILAAILILIAGVILARWVDRILMRSLNKKDMEPPVKMLISRIVKLLVIGFALVVALGTAGVNVMALVAGIGVAGVGVGLAMQGVLSNLFAGLTIIFTKPFRVGEYIEIAGVQGQVKQIELFSTVLLHGDLSRVVIPNRKIVGEILHNYGNIRQLDLSVGVGYASNINDVLAEVKQILANNPRVMKDPAPGIGVTSLGESSITIAVKPWTTLADFGPAQVEIYQAILAQFRAKKIEIPFPQREVKWLTPAPVA
ncbi:MAG TPA: mechanosensitive ion channel family protein [Verrucomicrobiae bacterium]|jgi:small conductance mechanosensitive channel|nr:mechanosensitive ion channel family protein [Verrucomicrobiae bacterium]